MTRLRITSAGLDFTRHENQFFPGVIEGEWDSQVVEKVPGWRERLTGIGCGTAGAQRLMTKV